MFAPQEDYNIYSEKIELRDIREYPDKFILRPPYQRHSGVWEIKMKESLLDSICRGYYVPKLVLRKIKFDDKTQKWEVIDGQQRLCTILDFFDKKNKLKLPMSLKNISPDIINKKYHELDPEKRKWFDKLSIKADLILDIENKNNPKHQKIAADLFFRLQQAEPLTFIEILHSKLDSNVRNFVSKYADTKSFDFEKYEPLENNKNILSFFDKVVDMNNKRMQYLLLMTRFLLVEFDDGPTDVGDKRIISFFKKYPIKNVANEIDEDFESMDPVKNCLSNTRLFYKIFKDNSMIDNRNGVKYIKKDYFVLSLYILLRYLKKYYVFDESMYPIFDKFSEKFYIRLIKNDENDKHIMIFRDNRQQSKENLETRDRIMRLLFFKENKLSIKDSKRFANEVEKIELYSKSGGICKECLNEYLNQGLSEEEAEKKSKISWKDYEADHIIAYIKGSKTLKEEMQVLCRHHNRKKGDN